MRRKVQLRALRPDLVISDLRGNVDTRLAKLDRGDYDIIVLAQAGLVRLGLQQRITEVLAPEVMTPAAGQGALVLEYRKGDFRTRDYLVFLADSRTTLEVQAEREFLQTLGGGCQVPIGVRAELQEDGKLFLNGMLSDLAGEHLLRAQIRDYPNARPGKVLAERLLAEGGKELVEEILKDSG